jgi:cobalt-zinc-cadmium efflux system membrane fusion protein
MDSVLYLDPDDYSLVRSRFQGEVVEMPMLPALGTYGSPPERSLRFGDTVKKGDLLAVVWSRELGEKKSELAQGLSSLAFDRDTLSRLSDNRAAVPINSIREAERRVREDEIAVERAEKTLRSWQLTTAEIQQIRSELLNEKSSHPDGKQELAHRSVDRWARVEVRSPIDGTIVEKNITVGTLVDLDDALFKIANLQHLDVRAFAYEEDLVTLQRLTPDQRKWTIRLKGDAQSKPILGVFDRIGSLIDPLQHTGLVMGWVDNADGSLRAGQFVTAAVTLPDPQPLICVPAECVVDIDGATFVLLQQENDPEKFLPVQVRTIRFQESLACIDPRGPDNCQNCLLVGRNVVTNGAVEILAEYQMHLKTGAPPPQSVAEAPVREAPRIESAP